MKKGERSAGSESWNGFANDHKFSLYRQGKTEKSEDWGRDLLKE